MFASSCKHPIRHATKALKSTNDDSNTQYTVMITATQATCQTVQQHRRLNYRLINKPITHSVPLYLNSCVKTVARK